jgi:hypothetical protein
MTSGWTIERVRDTRPTHAGPPRTQRYMTRYQAEVAARYVNLWNPDGPQWSVQVAEDSYGFELVQDAAAES